MKSIVTFVYVLMLGSLINLSCKKNDCKKTTAQSLTDAIITGTDVRACACCGGLMITFSNDPKTYSSPFFDINQLPSGSGIDEKSQFPIYVKVNYTPSTSNCSNKIDILTLEKR